MLAKSTRKRLTELNWVEIAEDDENHGDTMRRYKKQINKAINDLILIANKFPNKDQEEIFSYANIEKVIQAILNGNIEGLHEYDKIDKKKISKEQNNDYDKNFKNRILSISALLVQEGAKVCMEHYKANNQRTFTPVMRTLEEAAEICNIIAFPYRIKSKPIPITHGIKK
jgi:hypothetical protein